MGTESVSKGCCGLGGGFGGESTTQNQVYRTILTPDEPITIVTTCKSLCREEATKAENVPKIKLSFLNVNTGGLGTEVIKVNISYFLIPSVSNI